MSLAPMNGINASELVFYLRWTFYIRKINIHAFSVDWRLYESRNVLVNEIVAWYLTEIFRILHHCRLQFRRVLRR